MRPRIVEKLFMQCSIYLSIIMTMTQLSYAQSWIVGDTTNLHVYEVNKTFEADSNVSFDIDCDGEEDIIIHSYIGTTKEYPWRSLSFSKKEDCKVFNSNTGFVTTFEIGDTLPFTIDSLWTEHLGFIFGTGKAGPYGQSIISKKYIAFKKTNGLDTNYCYILFSNQGVIFTIHSIISACESSPFQIILAPTLPPKDLLTFSPNPINDYVYFSEEVIGYSLYSSSGKLIQNQSIRNMDHRLTIIEQGIYFIKLKGKSNTRTLKLIKI